MIGEKTPVTEGAQVLGVSRATLYRRVPELADVGRDLCPHPGLITPPSSARLAHLRAMIVSPILITSRTLREVASVPPPSTCTCSAHQ